MGSIIVPTLLAQGHEVTVLDNFYFGQSSLLDCCHYDTFNVVRGDAREESIVKPLVAKADVIIPLAALVGVPLCNTDQIATTTTNQNAVEMICKLASKQQWVVMPVTNSGYGIGEKGKHCTEDSPLRPLSTYGVTKVKAKAKAKAKAKKAKAKARATSATTPLAAAQRRTRGARPLRWAACSRVRRPIRSAPW